MPPPPLPRIAPPSSPQPPTLLPLKFKWPEPDRSNIATHCCYFPGSKYIVKIRHIQKAAAGKKGKRKKKKERDDTEASRRRRRGVTLLTNISTGAPTQPGLLEEHPDGVELFFRVCFKKTSIFHTTQPHHAAPLLSDKNSRRRDREGGRKKKKETEDEGVGEDIDWGGALGREG